MAKTGKRGVMRPLGTFGSNLALHLPRHGTFIVALGVGLAAGIIALIFMPVFALPIGAAVTYACYLFLAIIVLPELTPDYLRRRAAATDAPTTMIFGAVAISVLVSIITLFLALHRQGTDAHLEIGLSILSVLLGWFAVHCMAAFHYAFEFYEEPRDPDEKSPERERGLDFPGGTDPSGLDFIYFAFAIGTSTATSDVNVTTRRMRRIVTLHSIIAFFFNTLLFAATVNVAVAVGQG